ncbi:MAG: S1 RNA-binding domain-containing protein [Clostridiales bacterium]|nr:S1 RNA-binding domain-containing protein [Clostridiales bacterium]
MALRVGAIVEGTVKTITNFGAFIDLGEGVTGLVHISEIADGYVKSVNDFLEENQKVEVKVLSIDEENKKITLSMKKVERFTNSQPKQPDMSFEDRLSKFLKDSEERQSDVKRSFESKRGSSRR